MRHAFTTTYTGKLFYPLNPWAGDVCIEDIAHHLALEGRFSNALERPYSVAEHSVRVSRLLSGRDALAGLLHDASEAYLRDLPTPIKYADGFEAYRRAEANLQELIYAKYGCRPSPAVHRADAVMLHTEAANLFRGGPAPWHDASMVDHGQIFWPWGWEQAEQEFLARFRLLRG